MAWFQLYYFNLSGILFYLNQKIILHRLKFSKIFYNFKLLILIEHCWESFGELRFIWSLKSSDMIQNGWQIIIPKWLASFPDAMNKREIWVIKTERRQQWLQRERTTKFPRKFINFTLLYIYIYIYKVK